jgi:hypothetical protein
MPVIGVVRSKVPSRHIGVSSMYYWTDFGRDVAPRSSGNPLFMVVGSVIT